MRESIRVYSSWDVVPDPNYEGAGMDLKDYSSDFFLIYRISSVTSIVGREIKQSVINVLRKEQLTLEEFFLLMSNIENIKHLILSDHLSKKAYSSFVELLMNYKEWALDIVTMKNNAKEELDSLDESAKIKLSLDVISFCRFLDSWERMKTQQN